ncbi:MAG: cob(I)yrinic acid a,c-diamide adenosyltransferase [Tannerella sp.]|jgi:cob(I)alamin adenosyltransferase|nr:cob(I)yrinic acid a,c-diamide adenosyltransferase [Tannerella sp.]
MKKSIIYTRGGDKGMTSLVGGQRVPKTHLRLEAYGATDELNAFIGWLITEVTDKEISDILLFTQNALFLIGAALATDPAQAEHKNGATITPSHIERIEQCIDRIDASLPTLKTFVLPGGSCGAALAHVCRTVCRRAERQICRLDEVYPVEESIRIFINRLSDLLFVISRRLCILEKGDEILWDNACN